MMKKVSVLMGIYNCADTLPEAIRSIQAQTYENWELILCDDGSADDTYQVACDMAKADVRLIVIKNEENQGLNRTLNRCFSLATGDYIARMDGDDDCLPTRFEKQVACLDEEPGISIVSSSMIYFDENGEWGQSGVKIYPQPKDVVCGSPICHAPVMMRRCCLEKVGGYSEEPWTKRVEDVDLWIRLYAAGFRCRNLTEPLYRMRNDQSAVLRRKYRYRIYSTMVRLRGCVLLKLDPLCYVKSFKPMIVGLVPAKIRRYLRIRLDQNKK